MNRRKLIIVRNALLMCVCVFGWNARPALAVDAVDSAAPRVVVKKKTDAKKLEPKEEAKAKKADAKKTNEKPVDKKSDDGKKADEKKPKAKKAGGGVMKALFKAFVPKINAPQFVQPQGLPALPEGATKDEILALEEKIRKKPNGKQYLTRYEPQFESIRRGELRFIHDVCDLKRSEFQLIQTDANLAAKRALVEVAQYQLSIEQGWNGQPPKQPDMDVIIESEMLKSAEKHLSTAQIAEYRSEIEARQSFRKLADAEVIVAALDKELHLTEEQRSEIIGPIQEAWKATWRQNIQLLANNGNRYLPQLPKSKIQKHLTAKQKTAFSSVGQYGSHFFGMQIELPEANQSDQGDLLEELEFVPEEESQ